MRVVTVGGATIDIIATIASSDIEQMRLTNQTTSFLLMEPGRKIEAEKIRTFTGGGAVNTAVSFARQGFSPAALIKVGRDINAEEITTQLESEGVDTSLVSFDDDHATAVSLLIASHGGDAAIVTHRGANGFLKPADIPPSLFDGAGLGYFTNLSNASADLFPQLVEMARDSGAFVATNPGIRQLTRKTEPFFDSLQHVDLFICNYQEARALVPKLVERTGWDHVRAPAVKPEDLVLEIEGFRLLATDYFARMHRLGPTLVAITDGARGAYLSVDGTLHFQPVFDVEVVGTTGAGDSFASTLAGALVRGEAPQQALKLAARNAASVVSHADAHSGLLTAEALRALV